MVITTVPFVQPYFFGMLYIYIKRGFETLLINDSAQRNMIGSQIMITKEYQEHVLQC
jgi:hypothetical protein